LSDKNKRLDDSKQSVTEGKRFFRRKKSFAEKDRRGKLLGNKEIGY